MMLLRVYAARLVGGDFAPVASNAGGLRLLVESEALVRDHRSAALSEFRSYPLATHVFTARASGPVCICWRRSMLAQALGEVDRPAEAPGLDDGALDLALRALRGRS
jgi:hypothetical protein